MKNISGESLNITEENIKAMQKLFPEAFEEGKIDFDVLKQLLGDFVDDEEERYSFKWNGKGKALRLSQTPSLGTLRPCKEESKNWDTTENLYIEGDNLEVLKLLQKSYYGKVKMIYIDPPYNTGSDFIYPDDFRDNIENYKRVTGQVDGEGHKIDTNTESNGRFHTDWLNMMYPRLRLARNLLSDDGVIFISIDDNEQENLKKICDEVFGADNFVANISIVVKTEGRRYGGFAKTHEYALIYAKNLKEDMFNEIEIKGKNFKYVDEFGGFNVQELRNQNARAFNSLNRPNLRYPFYVDLNDKDENGFCKVYLEDKANLIEVYPITVNGFESVWRWGRNEKAKDQLYNLVGRKGNDGIIRIYQKMRKLTEKPKTVLIDKEYISIKGTKEIQEIFENSAFDFPKPVNIIKLFLSIGTKDNSLILDFFSGSATTAHAVMQLNAEDNGNRKFIMVQLPEPTAENSEAAKAGYKNICEIGKERIRRAGEKIKAEAGEKAANLDIGFKVFKLDTSNLKKWNPEPENLTLALQESVNNFLPGRTRLDVVYEILLKLGLPLTLSIEEKEVNGETVYIIGGGALMICLGENITLPIAEEIVKLHREYDSELWKVVFQDAGFASDMDKTNIKETLKSYGLDEDAFVCL